MTYMPCPNIDVCHSSDFKLLTDGEIMCADDQCGQIFGRWTAAAPPQPDLREEDLRVEVVNKWNAGCTARIVHVPTGASATGEGRSAIQAQAEALDRLRGILAAAGDASGGGEQADQAWRNDPSLLALHEWLLANGFTAEWIAEHCPAAVAATGGCRP